MSCKHILNYILNINRYIIQSQVYFGNLFYVTIIKFKVTCEALFSPMTDNFVFPFPFFCFFNEILNKVSSTENTSVLIQLPNWFLNSLPLITQSY